MQPRSRKKKTGFRKSGSLSFSTTEYICTKPLTSSESLGKITFRLTEAFLLIVLTSAVTSEQLPFYENVILQYFQN